MPQIPLRIRIAAAGILAVIFIHLSLVKVAPKSNYAQKTHYSLWGGPNMETDRHRVEAIYENKAPVDHEFDITAPGMNKTRANAAFVILARNSDLWAIMESIRFMEDRFNRKYKYASSVAQSEHKLMCVCVITAILTSF